MFLTNAGGNTPLPSFDADDDRRRSETCDIQASTPPWSVKHPPQNTARAVRVHVLFTRRMWALATASRLPCEQADTGSDPLGWQRWRRQLLEQTRDHVIVCAEGCYGLVHLAAYSRLMAVTRNDRPPGIGTQRHILAPYGLTTHGYASIRISGISSPIVDQAMRTLYY